MKQLLRLIFKKKHTYWLFPWIVISICLLTFSSQLEIFSIGVIAKKGPDFFELFAPVEEGRVADVNEISYADFQKRWEQIDYEGKGVITKEGAAKFLSRKKRSDKIGQLVQWLNYYIPLSGKPLNLALFLVLVALFRAFSIFSYRYSNRLVAISVSQNLRSQYFEHIQSLPMHFYQKYNIGSLSARVVGDAQVISEAISAALVVYFQTPFLCLTTLGLCFLTSWRLSLMVFLGIPLIAFPVAILARKVKRVSKQLQKNQESFASVLIDFLSGIQTVKLFAMEAFSLKKYQEQNEQMARLERKRARYDLSSRPIVHSLAMFLLAATLVWGLYGLQMSLAEVFVYCGLLYIFYEPIKKFAEENGRVQYGIAAAERMLEVLQLAPQISDRKDAVVCKELKHSIEFENVWFSYGEGWILKGVSFTVEKGSTVAIVGPTGAGKSTIVQLIPRLYDIQKGKISVDGLSLDSYTQKSLRELIAFVPQKPFLFLDTIAENISFGRSFSREQVEEAAKRAYADEFIHCLPDKYESVLSEAGKNLSGGQQQRLAIARALVKQAPILVMDEATSSLDSISEQLIKRAVQKLRGQVTQIVIAHRLATIEDADKIIYLEKGEKIGEGTREELLRSCPPFRRMWEAAHSGSDCERELGEREVGLTV